MKIKELMTTKIVTVEMDDSLNVIKNIFDNTKFHHLLVVENEKLFGIISDRDLLKALSPKLGTAAENDRDLATLKMKAHQIMSRRPFSLNPDDHIKKAIELFHQQMISCIPIVDDNQIPIGVVSWRDIIRVIITRMAINSS